MFIEAMLSETIGLPGIVEIVYLPLSRDTRRITSISQNSGERHFTMPIKIATAVDSSVMMKSPASCVRVPSAQQHRATCTAVRRRITICETNTFGGQSIDVRSSVLS
jgi:hypothetical protein